MLAMVLLLCTAIAVTNAQRSYNSIADQAVSRFGIDVSKWQGNINWNSVKSSGIDFAIIRAGYSGVIDPYFETNYKGAKNAGIDVGVYFYTYADSIEKARTDANNCLSWLKGKKLEYPVYFDIEDKKQASISKSMNTDISLTFLNIMKANGYLAGVYSSASWLEGSGAKVNTSQITSAGYEAWIARYYDYTYNDRFGYSQRYGMWQYSCKGNVGGVSGEVDLDICYRDYPSIVKQNGYNGYSRSTVTNTDTDTSSNSRHSDKDITSNTEVTTDTTSESEIVYVVIHDSDVSTDTANEIEDIVWTSDTEDDEIVYDDDVIYDEIVYDDTESEDDCTGTSSRYTYDDEVLDEIVDEVVDETVEDNKTEDEEIINNEDTYAEQDDYDDYTEYNNSDYSYGYYLLTVDLNGGEWDDDYIPSSMTVYSGDKIDLPIPQREGYKFYGWFITGKGSDIIDGQLIMGCANTSLLALWSEREEDISRDIDTDTDIADDQYFNFTFDGLLGDVNFDFYVSLLDVVMIQKHISLSSDFNDTQIRCADIDMDGEITMLDVVYEQKYIAKLVDKMQ